MLARTPRTHTSRYLFGLLLAMLVILGVGASATNALAGPPPDRPGAGGGAGMDAKGDPDLPVAAPNPAAAGGSPSAPNIVCGPVSFAPSVNYGVGTNARSAAVGDFNRDGKPDYLLFSPSTRRTAIWYFNDFIFIGGAYGPTLP